MGVGIRDEQADEPVAEDKQNTGRGNAETGHDARHFAVPLSDAVKFLGAEILPGVDCKGLGNGEVDHGCEVLNAVACGVSGHHICTKCVDDAGHRHITDGEQYT